MPKLYQGKKGGLYYRKRGRKVYLTDSQKRSLGFGINRLRFGETKEQEIARYISYNIGDLCKELLTERNRKKRISIRKTFVNSIMGIAGKENDAISSSIEALEEFLGDYVNCDKHINKIIKSLEKKLNPEIGILQEREKHVVKGGTTGTLKQRFASLIAQLEEVGVDQKSGPRKKVKEQHKVGQLSGGEGAALVGSTGTIEKYQKMLRTGIPRAAVEHKIRMENGTKADDIIAQLDEGGADGATVNLEREKGEIQSRSELAILVIEKLEGKKGKLIDDNLIVNLITEIYREIEQE